MAAQDHGDRDLKRGDEGGGSLSVKEQESFGVEVKDSVSLIFQLFIN